MPLKVVGLKWAIQLRFKSLFYESRLLPEVFTSDAAGKQ